jgi:hypothetical protein
MDQVPSLDRRFGAAGIQSDYPVSLQQDRRLERQVASGSPDLFNYIVSTSVPLAVIDGGAIQAALNAVVADHESLRSKFIGSRRGFRQIVRDEVESPTVNHVRIGSDESVFARAVGAANQTPFTATEAFLRGLVVERHGGQDSLVLFSEHIAADGVAMDLIADSFATRYAALLAGGPIAVRPSALEYKDWCCWQRATFDDGQTREAYLRFWRDTLGPAGPYAPSTMFHPLDGVEPAEADVHEESWHSSTVGAVWRAAELYRMTPFMIMLAAVQIAAAGLSGEDFALVHSPTANRPAAHSRMIVGWFAHALPYRLSLAGEPSLGEALARARTVARQVLAHQDLPFTSIVRELTPGVARPLTPPRIYLGYEQELSTAEGKPHVQAGPRALMSGRGRWARPGLHLNIALRPHTVDVHVYYGRGRIDPETVARLCGGIAWVIGAASGSRDRSFNEMRSALVD